MFLDNTDMAILQALTANSRLSLRKLAQEVHLTAPSVAERVRRLEEQNIITGYTIKVNQAKLDPKLIAYIHIFLSKREGVEQSFLRFAEEREEIHEIYNTVGDSCYLLKAAFSNQDHLHTFIDLLHPYGSYRLHLVIAEPIKK